MKSVKFLYQSGQGRAQVDKEQKDDMSPGISSLSPLAQTWLESFDPEEGEYLLVVQ